MGPETKLAGVLSTCFDLYNSPEQMKLSLISCLIRYINMFCCVFFIFFIFFNGWIFYISYLNISILLCNYIVFIIYLNNTYL